MHLAEIGAGRCSITEERIVAEPDANMRQVLLGLLVLHEDLEYAGSQRTKAEAELRTIAEERERLLEDRRDAISARDRFLAVAAHELRTPLATLALVVDHLIATVPPDIAAIKPGSLPYSQQLPMLKRQVDRLTGLVVQMLDVSRITRGGLDLAPTLVDLREIVREVLDRFALEIERRQVTVGLDAPDPVGGVWDAARVDQIVTNLMSNALKYGAGQPIAVAVRSTPPWATLVVQDHGIGIAEDDLSKVFGPFERAATAKHHAGLGLGLWISQQIAQASGGRISVVSQVGKGSTFTVELPL